MVTDDREARFIAAAKFAVQHGGRVARRRDGSVTIELPRDASDAVVVRFEELLGVRGTR